MYEASVWKRYWGRDYGHRVVCRTRWLVWAWVRVRWEAWWLDLTTRQHPDDLQPFGVYWGIRRIKA